MTEKIDWLKKIGKMHQERSEAQYRFSDMLKGAAESVIGPCREEFESVDYDVSPFDYGRVKTCF